MNKNFFIYLFFSIVIILSSNLKAEDSEFTLGIDIGYGFLDIGAEDTAQTIANLSGSTTTVTYDTGAFVGRIYGDFKIAESIYLDVGFFQTGDVDANYTLSGATASESYSANGFDISAVLKENEEGFFIKAGAHSSTVDGNASVTISGTTYAANAAASGTGFVFGGGFDTAEGSRIGLSYYMDLGGLSKADATFIYYGFRF